MNKMTTVEMSNDKSEKKGGWVIPKALSEYRTNFYGNKRAILKNIADLIPEGTQTVADLFGGTGIVSWFLKHQGVRTITNDIMRFAFYRHKAVIGNNNTVLEREDLDLLCGPNPFGQEYISDYYGRTFGNSNCEFLETWSANIPMLDDPVKQDIAVFIPITVISKHLKYAAVHFSPLGTLTGNQDFLQVDLENEVRSYALDIFPLFIFNNGHVNKCFQKDAIDLISEIQADVAYFDSPYNCRGGAYESFYGFYDDLASILSGHGDIIDNPYDSKSDLEPYTYFGTRASAITGFAKLFENSRHIPNIIVSYNSTSGIQPTEIKALAEVYGRHVTIQPPIPRPRPTTQKNRNIKTEEILMLCT